MQKLTLIPLLLNLLIPLSAQTISTIAGGGPHNLAALQTGFANVTAVAVDSAGNVYAGLGNRNQIWKLDTSGKVNLFAGMGGNSGYLGDGGPAVSATFCNLAGMAFDTAGNLYVADACYYSGRIRKISSAGIITTFAGGNSYFSNTTDNGDGGQASAARFIYPVAIALDASNNVYVADLYDNRVRKITASTGIVTTIAGNGVLGFSGDGAQATNAMLSYPNGVAVDSTGTVYICDGDNYRVRKVKSGIITTAAGNGTSAYSGDGGAATAASLNSPRAVAVDQFNDLFIMEASAVREIPAGQANIITFTGGGNQGYGGDGSAPTAAVFSYLSAMTFDSSLNLYLGDTGNYSIRKVSLTKVSTIAGNGTPNFNGDGGLGTDANFSTSPLVTTDSTGSLIFTNGTYSIRKLTLTNDLLTTVAGTGVYGVTQDGNPGIGSKLQDTYSLAEDAAGAIYFADYNRLRKLSGGILTTIANAAGSYGSSGDGGPALAASIASPNGLAVAANGDIYLTDGYTVRMINAQTGTIATIAGNSGYQNTGDGGPATAASLSYPSSLALDGNGNLYIAAGAIRKINLSTGIISTVAGTASGSCGGYIDGVPATSVGVSPRGLFADQSGNLFFSDWCSYRVRKVTASTGIISTVAGNGSTFSSGDGGSATAAGMYPISVVIDRSQNLYIGDSGSDTIRMTQVSACFFTYSAASQSISKSGGTGSFTITATNASCPYTVTSSSPAVSITSGASGTGSGTVTFTVAANNGLARTSTIAVGGQTFTVSQAGGSSQFNVGFFQPSTPVWVLDSNGSGGFDSGDRYFTFAGQSGAIAVVGDWNGDGRSKVGVYLNGFWALDYDGNGIFNSADKFYGFGGAGYTPVVGDWNGDGKSKVGFYYNGFWALDVNGNGVYDAGDMFIGLGGNGPEEVPVVGDWNGNGKTKVGFFYKGVWALDYDGDGHFTTADKYYNNFTYAVGDKPVVGDWTADGKTKIGIYRSGFWVLDANGNGTFDGVPGGDKFYGFGGSAGDIPVVADWNGDGRTKVGVYRDGFWTLDFNGNGSYDGNTVDRFIGLYGGIGSQPIIGRW